MVSTIDIIGLSERIWYSGFTIDGHQPYTLAVLLWTYDAFGYGKVWKIWFEESKLCSGSVACVVYARDAQITT